MRNLLKGLGFLLVPATYLAFPSPTLAVCPVCTVAVVAGLEVSRLLGIDDLVSAVWIGGVILSSSFWLLDWINKKWPKIEINKFMFPIIAFIYLIVLVPLKWNGSIGIMGNTFWGIDKILLGTTFGSLVFLAGMWADKKVREKKGKQLFQYQKVVFPVLGLIITSLVFYFITK
jgi:hypothetical protein